MQDAVPIDYFPSYHAFVILWQQKEEENLRAAIRQSNQKRRVRESHTQKGGLTANYLEPDRSLDIDEDISAIKSSVRSRVGGASGRGGRGYESMDSSEGEEEEEEQAHERLLRAKGSEGGGGARGQSPERGKRQTRASSAAKGMSVELGGVVSGRG